MTISPVRPEGPTIVAVARSHGHVLCRTPAGLDVTTPDGGRVRSLAISGLRDFACLGDEVWAFADSLLVRIALKSGLELGAIELPWEPTRFVVASGSQHAAMIADRSRLAWVGIKDHCLDVVEFEGGAATDFAAPLGGRTALVGTTDQAWIVTLGRRERTPFPIPPDFTAVAARGLMADAAVALIGAGPVPSVLIARRSGQLVHRVELPAPVLHVATAADRGLAVVALANGEAMILDLRYGKIVQRWQPIERAAAVAIGDSGSPCVLANDRGAGEFAITRVPMALDARPIETMVLVGRLEHAVAVEPAAIAPAAVAAPTVEEAPAEDDVGGYRSLATGLPSATPEAEPSWPDDAPVTGTAVDRATLRGATRELLESALCHAALLLERLLFLNRNLGLLPRTATADDPLGSIVISDSDVATILAGFRKIVATAPEARGALLQDPFEARVIASRATLRRQVEDPRSVDCGLSRIISAFALDLALTDMLVLALCPDWDLRMGKLLGFLNNDATQQRPRMGHLTMIAEFGLPAPDAEVNRRAQEALFDSGLLRRDGGGGTPVVSQLVRAEDEVVALSMAFVDDRAVGQGRPWSALRWRAAEKQQVRAAVRRELSRTDDRRMVIIEGIRGSGRMAVAQAVARELGKAIEVCDLSRIDANNPNEQFAMVHRMMMRARVLSRILVIRSEGTLGKHEGLLAAAAAAMKVHQLACFVLVRPAELEGGDTTIGFVRFEPPRMSREDRRMLWLEAAVEQQLVLQPADLDDIAARYDCPPGRVLEIVDELRFRRSGSERRAVEIADVRDTLRDLTVQRMRTLAKRYDSSIQLADLLFPVAVAERLEELVARLRHRHRVLSGWAFADKAHESYGVSSLFVGPPGTGKTAAAAAIANALHIDLYIVDFSSIMSKWVGETEQNLARIFDEAEASSVALLFDEADALFGKRSTEQSSSSDRYANLTVNYLLQRMETFSGLAILTTNLESAMDDAFQRRITSKIRFPETDEELRIKLWAHMLPPGARYADDVDLKGIAASHAMQGAHIRRALTRAAFRAAAAGRGEPVLTQEDLMWAAVAEYDDMGRLARESPMTRLVTSPYGDPRRRR